MEHAWKACKRDKRFVGSNPTSSVSLFEEAIAKLPLRDEFRTVPMDLLHNPLCQVNGGAQEI